ncbi:hypothetical protein [Rugamonas sp. DEMB1]|uniref:hypothetical protein n=1 Tax=Rugamonas sp. DEMB1 TaxID=3039386 RepID=UPI0024497B44|nr:hypothetical protein [Rugamonas sp. DEMB1]WGG53130.1 hypothetical protein QC826_14055 [Rugamonas sp. DEMB1]
MLKFFSCFRAFFGMMACAYLCSTSLVQAANLGNEMSRDNLMVVLRESIGRNKLDDTLVPTAKQRARLANGQEIEIEMAHFEFIGDMHIRFVFDGPQSMRNATPQDLSSLGLSTSEALQVAIKNIKRVYGSPEVSVWSGGLMQVNGQSPDLGSSYFLDHDFWMTLSKKYPEGIVVAVPKRGGLLFARVSDEGTISQLQKAIPLLYSSSGSSRISSALYLFKDGKWGVFQTPEKQ